MMLRGSRQRPGEDAHRAIHHTMVYYSIVYYSIVYYIISYYSIWGIGDLAKGLVWVNSRVNAKLLGWTCERNANKTPFFVADGARNVADLRTACETLPVELRINIIKCE